jgi:hypothetical protein
MYEHEVSLWIEFPVTGQWGTVQELWSRYELEDVLEELLAQQQLGEWSGGGQGLGTQDSSFAVPQARWQAAWALVRAKLAELGLLDRAQVRVFLDADGPPRRLWPPPSQQDAAPEP